MHVLQNYQFKKVPTINYINRMTLDDILLYKYQVLLMLKYVWFSK